MIKPVSNEFPARKPPMTGVRVLDFTRLLPGSICTLLLADYGAEVLKVEPPGAGDYARWDNPRLKQLNMQFLMFNRNKRSIVIDLKTEAGRQIVRDLATQYDVVVESFRPGVTQRLGISYEELSQVKPDLIYCSITGFGQTGPYRDLPAHDLNILALAGVLATTGQRGGPPVVPGIPLVDLGPAGGIATLAIVMALWARERTGHGEYIDISMLDGTVSWMVQLAYEFAGQPTPPRGELPGAGGLPCYSIYQTADQRYIALGALEPKFWESFCMAIERPELISHGLDTSPAVFDTIEKIFLSRDYEEWVELLGAVDTCWSPVLHPTEVLTNPQVCARSLILEDEHPTEGKVRSLASPIKFATYPSGPRQSAPLMGEHTQEVLRELGHDEAQISRLEAAKVVVANKSRMSDD